MFRKDTNNRVTHITETIMGHTHTLEVVRLSGADSNDEKNFADKLLDAFEKEEVGEFELPALLDQALRQNKIIHVADVAYHLQKNVSILMSDTKQLIYLHKFILEFSQDSKELSEESNALFIEFILKHTQKLKASDRYKIFEDLLSLAIHVYDGEEKKAHPMQTIINHLYHHLCGKKADQPVTKVNLQQTLSEVLIRHAQEKREQPTFSFMQYIQKKDKEEKIEQPPCSLRHSS